MYCHNFKLYLVRLLGNKHDLKFTSIIVITVEVTYITSIKACFPLIAKETYVYLTLSKVFVQNNG